MIVKIVLGHKCLSTNVNGIVRHLISSVVIYSSMSGLVDLEFLVFVGNFLC